MENDTKNKNFSPHIDRKGIKELYHKFLCPLYLWKREQGYLINFVYSRIQKKLGNVEHIELDFLYFLDYRISIFV